MDQTWIGPIAVGVLVFLVAAVLQAAVGFGSALVAMPLLLHVLDPADALFASCLAGALLAGWGAQQDHHLIRWPEVARLSTAALVGIPIGLALLVVARPSTIMVLTAVLVMLAVVLEISAVKWRPGSAGLIGCGVLSGSLLASSGVNGPPSVAALRSLPPRAFRASLQCTFFLQDLMVIAALTVSGRASLLGVVVGASAVVALPLGWRLGDAIFVRLDGTMLRYLVAALLTTTAVSLLLEAGRSA